jgi:hypothetical protein
MLSRYGIRKRIERFCWQPREGAKRAQAVIPRPVIAR